MIVFSIIFGGFEKNLSLRRSLPFGLESRLIIVKKSAEEDKGVTILFMNGFNFEFFLFNPILLDFSKKEKHYFKSVKVSIFYIKICLKSF